MTEPQPPKPLPALLLDLAEALGGSQALPDIHPMTLQALARHAQALAWSRWDADLFMPTIRRLLAVRTTAVDTGEGPSPAVVDGSAVRDALSAILGVAVGIQDAFSFIDDADIERLFGRPWMQGPYGLFVIPDGGYDEFGPEEDLVLAARGPQAERAALAALRTGWLDALLRPDTLTIAAFDDDRYQAVAGPRGLALTTTRDATRDLIAVYARHEVSLDLAAIAVRAGVGPGDLAIMERAAQHRDVVADALSALAALA